MRVVRRAVLGLLLAVVLAVLVGAGVAWQQGWRVYAVRTGSMEPTIGVGDLVVDGPPGRELPRIGQVVTVRTNQGLVSHRVQGVLSNSDGPTFTTRGDANPAPDSWQVPQRNLVGVVQYTVPRAGYVTVFLQQPTGVPALVLSTVAVLLAWSLFFGGAAGGAVGGPAGGAAGAASTSGALRTRSAAA
jgi:signal peptidase